MRLGLLVIALAGIVSIGAAPVSPRQDERAAEHGERKDSTGEKEKPPVARFGIANVPQRPVEPAGEDRKGDSIQEQSERDTDPAWVSAKAARDAADYAFWMNCISLSGLVVGGLTLAAAWRAAHWAKVAASHTEIAAEEARRAADEASDANRITVQSQRPWIAISFEPIFAGCRDGIFSVEVAVKFHNAGMSPAIATFFAADLLHTTGSYRDEIEAWFNSNRKVDYSSESAILPNETVERRISFMEKVENVSYFRDAQMSGVFLAALASVEYGPVGEGIEGRSEAARAAILQRRVRMKGRADEGNILSSFPVGEFTCQREELVIDMLAHDRIG
ncbi:hypothetical protein [Caenibius sp. WL]|uniref:hypothetical protein n=1 Tax=Caenibius sp. WL TaxID=2872646 RepID=UPI001C994182|nr:hypothetical protein [Caenibius sp. WL]QZP06826.1 hypothetical protein K5X80_08800 [Caenibius sp. WL]